MQTEPINQRNALALEMETWGLVAELAAPLYGHSAVPALIALRIAISHRHTAHGRSGRRVAAVHPPT
jgi:hypothetical protein